MNCHEVRSLFELFSDSELEPETTLQIQQHLAHCRGCARRFEVMERLDTQVQAALSQGQRSDSFWQEQEGIVCGAIRKPAVANASVISRSSQVPGLRCFKWRELLWPSPSFYGGLSVVWLAMLLAHIMLAEPAPKSAKSAVPPLPEVVVALTEQRRAFAELLNNQKPPVAAENPERLPPESQRRLEANRA